MAITHSKQNWTVGETVKVGFVTGLEVIKLIPTPGDYAPDAYVLWQASNNRFYQFVPHKGLSRRASLQDAMVV